MRRKDWPRKSGLGLGLGAGVGGGGIGYYLNDSFTTDVAAGSVNTSSIVPGPGLSTTTRTVTDPNSKVHVSTGLLKNSAVNSGTSYYAAGALTSAVVGKMIIGKEIITAIDVNNQSNRFAISNANNSLSNDYFAVIYNLSGVMSVRTNTFVNVTFNNVTTGSMYYNVIEGVGNKRYFLMKDGSGYWYLNIICTGAAYAANMYPLLLLYQNNTANGFDFIRIPTLLWTPKPISADDFGGTWPTTDGGGLTGIEAGGSGKSWVDNVGVWAIAAGSASCTTDGGVGIATVDTGKSDVYHWAKVTLAGGVVGLVTNYVDANNHVKIYHDGVTTVKVDEVVGGVATNRLTYNNAAIAYAADKALVARGIDGGASKSVYVWYKDVFCNAAATISDATIRAATKHGIYTTNNGNTFSEAFTYAVGSGGEYSNPLDMFIN